MAKKRKKNMREIERIRLDMLDLLERCCEIDVMKELEDIVSEGEDDLEWYRDSQKELISLTKSMLLHLNKTTKYIIAVIKEGDDLAGEDE
jgi:hypothetical protein